MGALLLACAGDPDAAGEADGSSTGAPARPTPAFVDPAGDELRFAATRHTDVEVAVSQVRPGITTVALDGVGLGSLPPGSRIGELDKQRLRLRLAGAMLAGEHSLELVTPDGASINTSDPLAVVIEPEPAGAWTWDLGDEVIGVGEAVIAGGSGARGTLVLVDHAAGGGETTVVSMWPALGHGWDRSRRRDLPLPGHRPAAGERVPALDVARRGSGDDERLRVAWRVDLPGRSIAVVEVDWRGQPPRDAATVVSIDQGWSVGAEYAAVMRPSIVGEVVLAEVLAAADAEVAHPGDRRVIAARLDAAARLVAAQPLQLGVFDVALLAPVLDTLADVAGEASLTSCVLGGQRLALVEIDPDSSTASLAGASRIAPDEGLEAGVDGFATLVGALGSRIAAAAREDLHGVVLVEIDDVNARLGVHDLDLPDGDPIAAPVVAGVVDGIPVFLVARGASDVVLVTVRSDAPEVVELTDLTCDAIVAARTIAGNTDGVLGVACLRSGELRLGTIAPAPPP